MDRGDVPLSTCLLRKDHVLVFEGGDSLGTVVFRKDFIPGGIRLGKGLVDFVDFFLRGLFVLVEVVLRKEHFVVVGLICTLR